MINGKVAKEDVHYAKKLITSISQFDKHCTNSLDCIAIPVGAKTCGGPSDYIVYSKLSTYADQIEKLATLTNQLEQEYNKENPENGPCSVIGAPTVTCSFNNCQRTSFLYAIMYPIGRS